ncbi:MAG: hypothetical protein FWF36_01200 [Propionibacteriaceae bacterium]|nr:hypothetical protein [Propionibacteriaceae bacterium]
MGSRYKIGVIRDVNLAQSRSVWQKAGLSVAETTVDLSNGWRSGAVTQVGPNIVVVGPPWGGPLDTRAGHVAEAFQAEVCVMAANTVIDYYEWSVFDASGKEIRCWWTDASGDAIETDSSGDPLPEEQGFDELDEAAIETFMWKRTGMADWELGDPPAYPLTATDEAD